MCIFFFFLSRVLRPSGGRLTLVTSARYTSAGITKKKKDDRNSPAQTNGQATTNNGIFWIKMRKGGQRLMRRVIVHYPQFILALHGSV